MQFISNKLTLEDAFMLILGIHKPRAGQDLNVLCFILLLIKMSSSYVRELKLDKSGQLEHAVPSNIAHSRFWATFASGTYIYNQLLLVERS